MKYKAFLRSKFEMKGMGNDTHVLGTRISGYRNSGLLFLDGNYLDKVFKRYNLENCKVLSTLVCDWQRDYVLEK
jgi:hypothetical protein